MYLGRNFKNKVMTDFFIIWLWFIFRIKRGFHIYNLLKLWNYAVHIFSSESLKNTHCHTYHRFWVCLCSYIYWTRWLDNLPKLPWPWTTMSAINGYWYSKRPEQIVPTIRVRENIPNAIYNVHLKMSYIKIVEYI